MAARPASACHLCPQRLQPNSVACTVTSTLRPCVMLSQPPAGVQFVRFVRCSADGLDPNGPWGCAGIGTKASLFLIVFMASIAFVAGVCVGLRLGTGTKIEKEIGTQTHELERLSVNVNELTIESTKVRLSAKDLRMSGLKGELADRLEANARW